MATVIHTCTAPGCIQNVGEPFKTPDGALSDVVLVLKMHTDTFHPPAVQRGGGQPREAHAQAERVKRPTLTLSGQSIDQDDYEHFYYQYTQYKERLRDNTDSSARLLEFLADDVSKMLFSNLGPEIENLAKKDIFSHISTCCVTKQTVQARTTQLHRIRQDLEQPVQSFLANLKSKVRSAT